MREAMRNSIDCYGKLKIRKFTRRQFLACILIAIFLPLSNTATAAEAAAKDKSAGIILTRADRIRFPDKGFEVDVTITSTDTPNGSPTRRVYRIISKGNDKTLVKTISPAIDRNQTLLMRDREFWAFLPNLSQPVRLPLSQRLTGEVANGDLARVNFLGDYKPRILRNETIQRNSYNVLELEAVDNWVTYHRVLYWVNAKNYRPFKAEFFALSGRLLKTAFYQKFHDLGGEIRPTQILIEDAINTGHRSVLVYRHMRLRNLPDKIFTKDYLKKLAR